jgi:hypothetical protein
MAFLATAMGVATAGFLINDLVGMYSDGNTKRAQDAFDIQNRVAQGNMLRQIGRETRALRNETAIMDLGMTLNELDAARPLISDYQQATAMTNNFLATLADNNRLRLASLSEPTRPSTKELLLEQAINKRFV